MRLSHACTDGIQHKIWKYCLCFSLVYLLTSVVLATLFREFKLRSTGADSTCGDPNYDGLVAMPTKEELWTVIVTGSDDADVEVIG